MKKLVVALAVVLSLPAMAEYLVLGKASGTSCFHNGSKCIQDGYSNGMVWEMIGNDTLSHNGEILKLKVYLPEQGFATYQSVNADIFSMLVIDIKNNTWVYTQSRSIVWQKQYPKSFTNVIGSGVDIIK